MAQNKRISPEDLKSKPYVVNLPLHEQNVHWARGIRDKRDGIEIMSPMFQCLICRQTIERSTRTYWKHKGHLLCSTCKDNIEAEVEQSSQQTPPSS